MKLYHGSKHNLKKIENRQATKANSPNVSDKQGLNGIYVTPDYEFAVAMASRPMGSNKIDNSNKTVKFENIQLFNPEQDIFIYTFDSNQVPKNNIERIDKIQYVITGISELTPLKKEVLKAKELLKYYKLIQ